MTLQSDDDPPIRDYRLTVKIRNNRLLTHIERTGARTVREFCTRHNLNYLSVSMLIRMERPAWSVKYQGWVPSVVRLSNVLGVPPDQLFSGRQVLATLKKRSIERQVDEDEMLSLSSRETLLLPTSEADLETVVNNRQLSGKLLDYLTERQRLVVENWLGLNGQPALTLEQIAELIPFKNGLPPSRERVRQIFVTALNRMRRRAVQLHVLDTDRVTIEGRIRTPQQVAKLRELRALHAIYGTAAMQEEFRNMRDGPEPPPPPPPLPLPQWWCSSCGQHNRGALSEMPALVYCTACGLRHRNSGYAEPKPPPRVWRDLPPPWYCTSCSRINHADLTKLPGQVYCAWCGQRHSNQNTAPKSVSRPVQEC